MKTMIEISDQRIKDLLCSAFEGGSNYWYWIDAENFPEGETYETLNKNKDFYPYLELPLMEGGSIIISSLEEPDNPKVTLDRKAIEKGLQVMAEKFPSHFGDFLAENDDATTGDVFLQCACFGDVVYC